MRSSPASTTEISKTSRILNREDLYPAIVPGSAATNARIARSASLLLDSLLADFRIRLNKNSLPGVSKTQPQIEVLAEIANLSEGVAYDFDNLLERYKEENNNSDKTHSGGVYVSKPPAQPEI